MKLSRTHLSSARQGGFTLVEVLATMVFLAILTPVAIHALTLSHRSSVIATRSSTAIRLGTNLLAELMIDHAWLGADPSGDFGEDWPQFQWDLTQIAWDQDELVALELAVTFDVQGREHSLRLVTLAREEVTE